MTSLYLPGQFRVECDKAVACYQAVNEMLNLGNVDGADIYMSQVLKLEGRRIYEVVLTMVAASRQIPPMDVPR